MIPTTLRLAVGPIRRVAICSTSAAIVASAAP